jgi:ankyrin repeat protein
MCDESNNVMTIDVLLANGADVNALNGDGRSPLHVAADVMNSKAIIYLLQKGASLDIEDNVSSAQHHSACGVYRYTVVRRHTHGFD